MLRSEPNTVGGTSYELSHDTLDADRELALRYLKAYRCLSGVPYEDIAVNPDYEAHAQAAVCLTAVKQRPRPPPG